MQGADLVRIFKYTGFKTPTEFYDETTMLDRVFLGKAVAEYEKEENQRSGKVLNAIFGKR